MPVHTSYVYPAADCLQFDMSGDCDFILAVNQIDEVLIFQRTLNKWMQTIDNDAEDAALQLIGVPESLAFAQLRFSAGTQIMQIQCYTVAPSLNAVHLKKSYLLPTPNDNPLLSHAVYEAVLDQYIVFFRDKSLYLVHDDIGRGCTTQIGHIHEAAQYGMSYKGVLHTVSIDEELHQLRIHAFDVRARVPAEQTCTIQFCNEERPTISSYAHYILFFYKTAIDIVDAPAMHSLPKRVAVNLPSLVTEQAFSSLDPAGTRYQILANGEIVLLTEQRSDLVTGIRTVAFTRPLKMIELAVKSVHMHAPESTKKELANHSHGNPEFLLRKLTTMHAPPLYDRNA